MTTDYGFSERWNREVSIARSGGRSLANDVCERVTRPAAHPDDAIHYFTSRPLPQRAWRETLPEITLNWPPVNDSARRTYVVSNALPAEDVDAGYDVGPWIAPMRSPECKEDRAKAGTVDRYGLSLHHHLPPLFYVAVEILTTNADQSALGTEADNADVSGDVVRAADRAAELLGDPVAIYEELVLTDRR